MDKWKDEFYVESYRHARAGLSDQRIAKKLGVTTVTFNRWVATNNVLRKALSAGRDMNSEAIDSIKNRIHGRLSGNALAYWVQLNSRDIGEAAQARADLKGAGRKARQHLFLHALVEKNFSTHDALRVVGIARKEYELWCERDKGFNEFLRQLYEVKQDFFESSLVQLVRQGDTTATVFANKTLNRNRGYAEKMIVEKNETITHKHKLDLSDLNTEEKKIILGIWRTARERKELSESKGEVPLIGLKAKVESKK